MPRKKTNRKIEIDSYSHKGKRRKNNPPVGLVTSATDKMDGKTKYAHDPHIDPYLSWAGKKEGEEFEVQNISLHIHERIDPKRIVQSFLKKEKEKGKVEHQMSLFSEPENEPPLNKAIDFYRHEQDWTNRLIAGDSLLVMNSLLNKEGMAGKVQMIYIDPPYGIKYNSNFQPFMNKTQVKDNNDDDIPAEPEMITAFRDTWELGIHSYLTHLRQRLLLAKELLTESGSIFIQINDLNVHHVREVVDEIFDRRFVSLIAFQTATTQNTKTIPGIYDYLIWYSKSPEPLFNHLYREQTQEELEKIHNIVDKNGLKYKAAQRRDNLTKEQLDNLKAADRLTENGKYVKRFIDDFPYTELHSVWSDTVISTFSKEKIYVVQTNYKVIERCILMTTNPGDIVLDPTCGSGTTAYSSEKWGRRWITCDTSRVAVTLAKQRLLTSKFDYYELMHKEEGVRSGIKCKKVPHVLVTGIANGESPREEILYDHPVKEKNKIRVAGPFTVEAVPSLRVKPLEGDMPKIEVTGKQLSKIGDTANEALWRDELIATGIRGVGNKMIKFSRIEPMKGTRFLHAEAEIIEEGEINKNAVISFGSEYGPMEQRHVEEAIKEARSLKEKPDFVIFAAFHFDPEAAKDIDEINEHADFTILKAQMSVDLLTQDLRKKKRENQSYWLIGQPDVEVEKFKDDTYKVKVNGFDYYDPVSGEIESKSNKHIAMWFLDTDYDERSLLPDQVFFPQGDAKRDWTKLAKALNGEVDDELIEAFTGTESIPFKAGDQNKVAVKIIDNRGIESFVIKKLQ